MERRGCKFMAPIHTVTWRDDAQEQTKIQVLDSFVQRREIALATPWRCYPDRVALLSDRRGTAKNSPKADTPLSMRAFASIIAGAQRRSITVRPDHSVDRLAAQIPGGGRCQ
jgi:hypothetical protein